MTKFNAVPLIADIVLVLLFVMSYSLGAKRGLSKYLYKLCATAGSIILAITLAQSASSYLAGTNFADMIYDKVYASVEDKIMNSSAAKAISDFENTDGYSPDALSKELNLPKIILSSVMKNTPNLGNTLGDITESISRRITVLILKIITLTALFILIRFLFFMLFKVLDGASKLPVLKSINRFTGGLLGLIQMLLFVYILTAALTLLLTGEQSSMIHDIIDKTYIVKFFYEYNIIIQLLMKI